MKNDSTSQLIESRIVSVIKNLGVPTAIACFFLGWFFYYYFPKHEEFTEKRINQIIHEAERNRQTQIEIFNKQSEIFQTSLRDIMTGVARLEKAVSALEKRIEDAEARHLRARDK